MNQRELRKLARRKCASALEQAISSGDRWTFTGPDNKSFRWDDDEIALEDEIKRVVAQLRGLRMPPR